jgi:hypothetical protein
MICYLENPTLSDFCKAGFFLNKFKSFAIMQLFKISIEIEIKMKIEPNEII